MEINHSQDGLLIVDLQNDFCGGGVLAVPGADELLVPLNRLMKKFRYVITTQDWHTCDHSSFQPFGGRWPVHCVARTRGARLHPRLDTTRIFFRIKKGTSQKADGYSGFEAAVLAQKLSEWGIVRLFLTGVATEYCVKATALDGLRAGFQVVVLKDLVRSIRAEDGRRALSEIERAGGKVLSGSLF